MRDANRTREETAPALRPIGVALAAVVAGLGAPGAAHAGDRLPPPAPPTPRERAHVVEPAAEEVLVPLASEPMEVFGDAPEQGDLFAR